MLLTFVHIDLRWRVDEPSYRIQHYLDAVFDSLDLLQYFPFPLFA